MVPRTRSNKATDENRERSGQLRPGRVRLNPSSHPRMIGTACNLLRLARMVSRTSKPGIASRGSRPSAYLSSTRGTSPFQRRAIVNVRYSTSRTRGGWKAHGTYIERESAKGDRENPDAERFGLAKEQSLGSLADGWQKAGDRRLFKIVLSPENPGGNLELTTQEVIRRIEKEVSGTVEWGAVVHRNTDHPHVHIIVRDRLPSGVEFTLPRDLIRRGLREAVQNSLTRQLGPRTIEEIEEQKQTELTANRITPLDCRLADRLRSMPTEKEFKNLDRVATLTEGSRLRHLAQLGLAKPLVDGQWQIRSDFLNQLRNMKDIQDRARTLFRCGVAISDPHAPMEYSLASKKLIGRVLLNSEDERTGTLQTIFETTEGKIEIIRHDAALRSAWARGDLQPGNVVVIDSLRSNPDQIYASSEGKDKDILLDGKALDSIARRIRSMDLVAGKSNKGWMGEFNKTLRSRMMNRQRDHGY